MIIEQRDPSEQILEVLTESGDTGMRIDKFLSTAFPEYSRSFFQKRIEDKAVFCDFKPVKSSDRILTGQHIRIVLPEPVSLDVEPENIPLDILYEDSDVLLVNKPKGMVVHPGAGHTKQTLVNAVLYHCRDQLSGINGVLRPGIVHRIDKDTTGVIVICKNDFAHNHLALQLKEHSITRQYRAIVYNNLKDDTGTIDKPIGRSQNDRKKMCVDARNSRNAVTHYRVLERFGRYTYIECELETGRTHQIRVHMASIGHPVLGDAVYGPATPYPGLQGQTLHAMTLGFIHPTKNTYMEFTAPLPQYFTDLLEKFRKGS